MSLFDHQLVDVRDPPPPPLTAEFRKLITKRPLTFRKTANADNLLLGIFPNSSVGKGFFNLQNHIRQKRN